MLNTMNTTTNDPEALIEHRDYDRIASALAYLYDNQSSRPSLSEAAEYIGLSEFHFQRLFRRWAGISPKQFCQYLNLHESRERLLDSKSLLEASIETGMSGASRLHDCYVSIVAMTPAEYRDGGAGLHIHFAVGQTPFGNALVASTARGVCMLEFLDGDYSSPDEANRLGRQMLNAAWPAATVSHDPAHGEKLLAAIFTPRTGSSTKGFLLHTRGTNFQVRVWEALLQLPLGYSVNYETLAAYLNIDGGARAVASAVARNPVGFLIPCHRVIRKTGVIGQYRWGSARKHAILGYEGAQQSAHGS